MDRPLRKIPPDRRQGPDFWTQAIRWMAIVVWALMLAALFILGWAKPQVETFFDRYYNLSLRSTWNMDLAQYIFFCMVAGFLLSAFGLVINRKRHRREGDEYLVSLVLAATICGCGMALYLYSF